MLEIEQGLVSDFIAQAFGLPIAHENADYTPTPGTAWVALRVFQNPIDPTGLADLSETTGLFQFTLHYPAGEGAIPAKAMAATIFDAYPLRRRITYSGQTIQVVRYELFDASPQGGWFQVVGRIYYRAYLD